MRTLLIWVAAALLIMNITKQQFTRLAACLFFVIALAGAEGPRHLDFTAPLMAIGGKPMRVSEGKDAAVMTLGDAAVGALEAVTDEDRALSGAEKFKRDQLARKVYGQKDVVLSVEEVALIKDRIGKVYMPGVIGAAWPMLDPSLAEKPPAK